MNPEGLFRDWFDGWRRLYRPENVHGATKRAIGEARIDAALACVDEDGDRIAPFPDPRAVSESALYYRHHVDAQRRLRRELLGVA